jgi:hypothetical protein
MSVLEMVQGSVLIAAINIRNGIDKNTCQYNDDHSPEDKSRANSQNGTYIKCTSDGGKYATKLSSTVTNR